MKRFYLVLFVIFMMCTDNILSVPSLYGISVKDSVVSRRNTKSRVAEVGRTPAPISGNVKILFIPVQFQIDTDDKTTGTGQFPYRVWGPTADNFNLYFQNRIGQVKKYYSEVSGNAISIVPTLAPTVTLPNIMTKYGTDLTSVNPNTHKTILEDTVSQLSNISFSSYNVICLIHAGAGSELGMGSDVKDLASVFETFSIPVNAPDGTNIYSFALLPETQCNDSMFNLANSGNPTADEYGKATDKATSYPSVIIPRYWDVTGTWCHEIAHAFGLADLYNANPASTGVSLHDWTLMAHGSYLPFPEDDQSVSTNITPHSVDEIAFGSSPSHLDAWSKMQLKWVADVTPINDVATVTLSAQQYTSGFKSQVYKLWTDGNIPNDLDFQNNTGEYFLIENRAQLGFDEYLPESGMMIYHIDDSVGIIENNNLQQDLSHPRVMPLSSDNLLEVISKASGSAFYDNIPSISTTFPGVINAIDDNTSPSTRKYNGDKSWVSITKISQSLNKVYATISVSQPSSITLISPLNNATIYGTMPIITAKIGSLQSPTLTLNNVQLPVIVTDGIMYAQQISALSPGSYPYTISGRDRVTNAIITSNYSFTVAQKQIGLGTWMLSIPVVNIGSATTVIAESKLNENLCRYDPILSKYIWYPNFDFNENSTMAVTYSGKTNDNTLKAPAGLGFWLKRTPQTMISSLLTLNGDTLANDLPIYIKLAPGFNMVGNPFLQSIPLSSCNIEVSGVKYSFDTAVKNGYVSKNIFSFNGSGYTASNFDSVNLQPWNAYWIEATKNTFVKLIVTPGVYRSDIKSSSKVYDSNNWEFLLKMKNEENNGMASYLIGIANNATDGYDNSIDISAPPVSPLGVSMTNRSSNSELVADYKSYFTDEKCWDVKVRSVAGNNIITSSNLLNVPGKFDIFLYDLSSGYKVNLRTAPSYSFYMPEIGDKDFRVIIKKRSNSLNINGLRQEISRRGDRTRVSWSVSQDGLCNVEIRNISGRLVFSNSISVVADKVTDFNWDGNDFNGKSAPTGTYQLSVKLNSSDGRIIKAVTIINK